MDASLSIEKPNVEDAVTRALAEYWNCTTIAARQRIADNGSDCILSAKEVMAVGAMIEELLGCEIFSPNDFASDSTRAVSKSGKKAVSVNGCMDPAEDCSIRKLTVIINNKMKKQL